MKTEVVEKLAQELLTLMGSKAEVKVSEDKENQAFLVDIKTDDETGLLIGRHGETLLAIQTVLALMVKGKTGEWQRLVVNVGDWREKEEAAIKKLAEETIARVKETGQAQSLYNLSPNQRRIIHLFLSESSEVTTESQGEGRDRFLIIRPKK